MHLRAFPLLPVAMAAVLAVAPADGRLVINELAPDPAGADAGHEFVEILNGSELTQGLAGVSLQFANGAEGPVWRTRWTADAGAVLAPGERFLVADRNWQGTVPADAEVWLGLQNGPDALRLVRGDSVLDLVGWGALTDTALCESAAVPLVPGRSLARRPDGRDTQDNLDDFVDADPTPGSPNFATWSLEVTELAMEPPSLARPGDAFTLEAGLRNDGLTAWAATEIVLQAGAEAGTALLDTCPPGAERRLSWRVRPTGSGRCVLTLRARIPGGPGEVILALGAMQVGPGPVVLNEVMAVPRRGEGEWIELLAVSDTDLGDWRLRDEDGDWRSLPSRPLHGGDRVVLAQDEAALTAWLAAARERGGFAACPPEDVVVLTLAGWPVLNNSAPADRSFAERLHLADAGGTVMDHVVIGGRDGTAPDGVSWERAGPAPRHPVGAGWGRSTAITGGTPGCRNSLAREGAAGPGLTVTPAVLDAAAGQGAVHLRFLLHAGESAWRARVYDLWGAPVRDFGGDQLGAGPRDLVWDGRDDGGQALPAGGYVALLVVRDAAGRTLRRERVVVPVR